MLRQAPVRRRTPVGPDPSRAQEHPDLAPFDRRAQDASLRDHQHTQSRVAFPVLAAFYLALVPGHALVLAEPLRGPMMAAAAATSLAFGVLALLRDRAWVRAHADTVAVAFAALVCGNGVLHLVGSGDAYQSTNLLIAMVGASLVFTSVAPFATSLLLCASGFAVAAWWHPADPMWVHFGFALAVTDVMAGVIFVGRRVAWIAQARAEHERDELDAQRQRFLESLAASEASYRELVRHSPAAMVVHRDGRVLYANLAASELVGAGDDTVLIGTRLYDLFAPDHQEATATWSARALAGALGDETLRVKLRALHGDWPTVQLAAARIRWEGQPAAILVATAVPGTP